MSEDGEPRRPDDDEDDLPDRDDPYWAGLTADTLAYVRRLRAAERRRRLGSAAYTLYVIAVVVAMYVVPYVWYALSQPHGAGPERTAATWPLGAAGVALLVLLGFARDGSWRGPALVDRPTAAWLLTAPIDKAALLRPRWRTALVVGSVTGAALGAFAGIVVRVVTGGPAARIAAAGALAGLMLTAAGTALGGLAELRREDVRGAGWAWLAPAGLLVATVAAGRFSAGSDGSAGSGADPAAAWSAAAAVGLWSGPWGWAVQPFVAALPGTAPGGAERLWPLGAALALALGVALVVRAERRVPFVDTITLRARADAVALVGGAVFALQPRRARLTVLAAQGRTSSNRWRLPVPRRRWLLAPWRDLTALLRTPSRLVWSLLWLATAVALFGLAWRSGFAADLRAATDGSGAAGPAVTGGAAITRLVRGERLLLGVPALAAFYLAVAQLVEAARLDADDVRRLRIRPTAATRQALSHLVVPIVVVGGVLLVGLSVVQGVGGLPVSGAGSYSVSYAPGSPGELPLAGLAWPMLRAGLQECLAALPAMAGAALVSAYRGDVPFGVLATGSQLPTGDPGPVALLAWYGRAPLVAVLLLLPRLLGLGIAGPMTSFAAVVMIIWAGTRAEAMLRKG